MKSKDNLAEIKKAILTKPKVTIKRKTRAFDSTDVLKHYVRVFYWKKRVEALKGDINLLKGIKYFSLCSLHANDVRMLLSHDLINLEEDNAFVFCEYRKEHAEFLNTVFLLKRLQNRGTGFEGVLAKIATIQKNNKNYGRFWGTFPFDVINLDFYGDLFKHDQEFAEDDFYAIQAIVLQQALRRKPYELWITYRVKAGRIDGVYKRELKKLIDSSLKDDKGNLTAFGKKFEAECPGCKRASDLDDEQLFTIGYLKWLFYVAYRATSSVTNFEILKYARKNDKDENYNIYKVLLRIEPYKNITIPSPASDAEDECIQLYQKNILRCFSTPVDIDKEFKAKATRAVQDQLKDELKGFQKDFEADKGNMEVDE